MKQLTFTIEEEYMTQAEFNHDRTHRFWLMRRWSSALPMATVIGLNPSRANESDNDPTIKSIIRILKHNAYGGFYMTNLFTMVTPYPDKLVKDLNEKAAFAVIKERIELSQDVIFAWGAFKAAKSRDWIAKKKWPDALCFGLTADGSPKHALFLKRTTEIKPYEQNNTP